MKPKPLSPGAWLLGIVVAALFRKPKRFENVPSTSSSARPNATTPGTISQSPNTTPEPRGRVVPIRRTPAIGERPRDTNLLKPRVLWTLIKATYTEWTEDNVPRMGAA